MKFWSAVVPVFSVLVLGLIIMWNLGTQTNLHVFKLPPMKVKLGKNISISETREIITYGGDGSCEDNVHRESLEKILNWWVKLAGELKVTYTLSMGSLIGAYRNNDVIPWDHDIDVFVSYQDLLKLAENAEPRNFDLGDGQVHMTVIPKSQHNVPMDNRKRYTCRGKETPKHVDQCSIQEPLIRIYHHWSFLDIFNYIDNGKQTLTAKHEYSVTKFKRMDILPPKPCLFMHVMCMCPNKPKNVLEQLYGPGFAKPNKVCQKNSWVNI